ncbi:hypothetical protein LTR85_009462 [Meristemomyces frigidus]|nr:hypothetical protein LTR85_009462 [Meristemomyces frigidus]
MDHSPLATLPRELRDEIYRLTFYTLEGVTIGPNALRDSRARIHAYKPAHAQHLVGIMDACKQLRQEMLDIIMSREGAVLFYSLNTFHFSIGTVEESLRSHRKVDSNRRSSIAGPWLAHIGAVNASLIRIMDLKLDGWMTEDKRWRIRRERGQRFSHWHWYDDGHNTFVREDYPGREMFHFGVYDDEEASAARRTVTLGLQYTSEPFDEARSLSTITLPIGDTEACRQRIEQGMSCEARRLEQAHSEGKLTAHECSDLTVQLQKCRGQLEQLISGELSAFADSWP